MRARAVRERREQQRPVRDRLVARQPQPAAQRPPTRPPKLSYVGADARSRTRPGSLGSPQSIRARGSRDRAGRSRTRRRRSAATISTTHLAPPSSRVRDLHVDDVHAEPARQRRHLRQHAWTVGHGDAQLDQVGRHRHRRPGGCGGPRAPARATPASSSALAGGDDVAHAAERRRRTRRARRAPRRDSA